MSGCHFVTCFDPTHNYVSLAQLAGLLAGFAFTTLVTVLTVSLASRQQFADRLVELRAFTGVLFCAFVGLGFAAYDYIFVGGEEVTSGRALSEGFIADVSMMTATLLLPLAIVELIEFAGLGQRLLVIRATLFLLLMFFYLILVTDNEQLRDPSLPYRVTDTPSRIGLAMSPVMLLLGLVGGWKRRLSWRRSTLWVAQAALGVILAGSVAMQFINMQDKDFVLPAYAQIAIYIAAAIGFGCAIAFVWATRDEPLGTVHAVERAASETA